MKNPYKIVALVAVIVVISGLGIIYFKKPKINDNQNINQPTCTQEALLCPDGSSVSRQGPNCNFTSCPNGGPYEGKLMQNGGSFRLIMASPNKNVQEVDYVMPFSIKISNSLATLIGEKVRVYGTFENGNFLKADRLEKIGDITLGQVKVGRDVFINGVRITLNSIVQDSRCPVDVQCIQAGKVVVNVTLKSDTDFETVDMSSDKVKGFDSFSISIESILPQKKSTVVIDPKDYVLTFKVTETKTRGAAGSTFLTGESPSGGSENAAK